MLLSTSMLIMTSKIVANQGKSSFNNRHQYFKMDSQIMKFIHVVVYASGFYFLLQNLLYNILWLSDRKQIVETNDSVTVEIRS